MPSALSLPKLLILIIATGILPNFAQSDELEKYSKSCKQLTDSLDILMNSEIITHLQNIPIEIQRNIKIFFASSEEFANGMHEKIMKFLNILKEFVETSKKYAKFLPQNQFREYLLDEEAISHYWHMLTTRETELANKLDKREFSESMPFPLAKFIANFFGKMKKFVRSLKRELIYAQSQGIIRKLDKEFQAFAEEEILPIKELVQAYVAKQLKSLENIIEIHKTEVGTLANIVIVPPVPEFIDKTYWYQEKLKQKRAERLSKMEASSSSFKGKKSKDSTRVLEAERNDFIESIERNLFDKLEENYMANNEDKNFLVDYNEYFYIYGTLERSANELNKKLNILIEELLTKGQAEMAKYEEEIKIVYVLAENIVNPLLKVIGTQIWRRQVILGDEKQMGQEYGPEKFVSQFKTFEQLAIPKEMIMIDQLMFASIKKENITREIKQYQIRLNALKVLVIYERLEHFFRPFENVNVMGKGPIVMARNWLNGNGQNSAEKLYILPERFGRLIRDEAKKLQKEKGKDQQKELTKNKDKKETSKGGWLPEVFKNILHIG